MGEQNSQIHVYVDLLCRLMLDNPFPKSAQSSIGRDIKTIRSRVNSEGLKFLTVELPRIGKALDEGLETSVFPPVTGFARRPGCMYPAFLEGCMSRIFSADGSLCPEPDVQAIAFVRQVCFMFYKMELPYDDRVVETVLQNFKTTDATLPTAYRDEEQLALLSAASNILSVVFCGFDPRKVVPRHGPGAVATGERLDEKWEFSRLYEQIHQFYPYYEYFVVGGADELVDRLQWYRGLTRLPSGTAKVVLVPKDSRGPRLISSEPLEYQWIQQGLGRSISDHLEACYLTKGQINFTHQSVNQMLALESSNTREFATLDLKDASDRVSLALVRELFRNEEDLLRAFMATRSTHTRLPDGEAVELRKFAPMGSALCFPVESVCFWALCVAAISRSLRTDFRDVATRVFVYGDDLIVPTASASVAMDALESVGLLVNRSKSYHRGFFRESCGVDAYKGQIVTPIRAKKPFTHRKSDGTCYAAWTALANALAGKGYMTASEYVFALVEETYGRLPYGTHRAAYPCRIVAEPDVAETLNKEFLKSRWNSELQRTEFEVRYLKNRQRKTDLDGWQRLLRDCCMPPRDSDPSVVVVPRSTEIKRGWRPV